MSATAGYSSCHSYDVDPPLSCGLLVVSPSHVKRWAHAHKGRTAMIQQPVFNEVQLCPGLDRVCRSIGRGRYGSVLEAVDPYTNQLVAVKLTREVYATHENQLQRLCAHKNVCAVHVCAPSGVPDMYGVVMEYCDATLRDVRRLPLPEAVLRGIAAQLLDGVAHVHSRGVIHLDINTVNVLLDRTGRVKIADFGLAQEVAAAAEHVALEHDGVVTVNYRAPELLLGCSYARG
jgi:serine/threonine protein kinase